MKIALISDTHWGITKPNSIKKMLVRLSKEPFDVLIHAGDYSGTREGFKPTRATVKLIREFFPEVPYLTVLGNHECLTEDCEILTKSGWKNIKTLSTVDEVATMTKARKLEWNKVEDKIVRDFDKNREDVYLFDKKTASIGVTSNHRMYTYNRSTNKVEVKLAKECGVDFSVINSIHSNTKVNISNDYLRLAAWFCTDSYFNSYGKITLYQRLSNSHKIHNLLNKLSIPYTHKVRNRETKQICGKELQSCEPGVEFYLGTEKSRELSKMLSLKSNKSLPKWFKELSDEQWEVFQNTLVEADGSVVRDTENQIFYGKKAICEQVQIGAVLHGWRASLKEYRSGQWRVNLNPRIETRIIDFPNTKTKKYSGKVWCITVKNNNFITRRNGKVHLTGNCWTTGKKTRNVYGGNSYDRPSLETFNKNITNIRSTFEDYNVHFLDDKGLYIHEDFQDIIITGHTGWYKHTNPPTNDIAYLPHNVEGNTHNYLYKKSIDELEINLKQLDHYYKPGFSTVVYVSHFPVVDDGTNDYKGAFEQFCGDPNIAEVMQRDYNCKYFLEGHSHKRKEGPLKYNSGSDYCDPNYLIVEV